MTDDLIARIDGLDDLTTVNLLRQVAVKLFREPESRQLIAASSVVDGLAADLAGLSAARKQEALSGAQSIRLARALLAALAAQPRFVPILAEALRTLRRDELAVEARVPRGLAADLVRLLASAHEADAGSGLLVREMGGPAYSTPPSFDRLAMQILGIEEGQAAAPAQDSAPPPAVATRTSWPLLHCAEAVEIGLPFDLEVGLRPERDPKVGGTGGLLLPVQGCTLEVQLLFDPASFAIVEGPRSFQLEVTAADPYPRQPVKLVALTAPGLPERRDIGVAYVLQGVLCGFATRGVLAVTKLAEAPSAAPARSFAGMQLAPFTAADEADLTIIIKRGDDAGGGRLTFAACSPHFAVPAGAEPPTASLGTQPAKFLEHVLETAKTSGTPHRLFTALKGLGRQHIGTKLPPPIKEALRRAAAQVAPRPASVLIISDDPYVPWELAVLEPPLVAAAPEICPFLGAQVTLGRWVLPNGERPPPRPCRQIDVRAEAVVTAVYERVPHWPRLTGAEAESKDLLKAWAGSSCRVEATFDAVMACLAGQPPADLLHFALHGQFDLSGAQEGLVLIEQQAGGARLMEPTFLRPDDIAGCALERTPFVFLNACQVGAAKEVLGDYAGMVEAFLFAGASAVVAPLWAINDDDARRLARQFYEAAWQGEAPAELLRRQRACFTERAAKQEPTVAGSPTHLAYQFFGHPKFVLARHQSQLEGPL